MCLHACLCECVCVRMSWLTTIIISASFRKRVWWSADWPAEGYSVSWIPWGVSGWADLLLAHTCAIRPKDPPALPGLWLGGRHSVSCRLPGGLRQLRWRLGLRRQVRISDQSIGNVVLTGNVCIIGSKYRGTFSVQSKTGPWQMKIILDSGWAHKHKLAQ